MSFSEERKSQSLLNRLSPKVIKIIEVIGYQEKTDIEGTINNN